MGIGDIFYLIFVLGLLVGVMYGVLFLMKKYLVAYGPKGMEQAGIEVVSMKLIMPKKYLAVARINNQFYLIGISESNINLIDKLENFIPEKTSSLNGNEAVSLKEMLKKNLGIR